MFIRVVDEGLERMLRAALPLPEAVGDISFDMPTGTWSAQLARITVNLYLYDIARSNHPSRSPLRRVTEAGVAQRRVSQPMIQLSYLVSAWAGNPRDEHQLLGDVISRIAGTTTLPEEFLPGDVSTSIDLSFVDDERNKQRDVWSGVGGQLKPSFTLQVSVGADTFDWQQQAPEVTSISALVPPKGPGVGPVRSSVSEPGSSPLRRV
jgi:hypothetical protein